MAVNAVPLEVAGGNLLLQVNCLMLPARRLLFAVECEPLVFVFPVLWQATAVPQSWYSTGLEFRIAVWHLVFLRVCGAVVAD